MSQDDEGCFGCLLFVVAAAVIYIVGHFIVKYW